MFYKPNFKLEDNYGLKANYHSHTVRCGHAYGTEREYIDAAVEAGFKVYGFSDHAPIISSSSNMQSIRMSMDMYGDYFQTVTRLKEEYEGIIKIYCGLEMEYIPGTFERSMEALGNDLPDYMILGEHYIEDFEGSKYAAKPFEDEKRLALYTERVLEGIETGCFLYVAHPDIIGYTGPEEIKLKYLKEIALSLKAHNMPVEVNGGGVREDCAYPDRQFIKLAAEEGCSFIIGVDCHEPQVLLDLDSYETCKELVISRGGKLVNI